MLAIIKTGGKQYKVAVGDKIKIEKLEVEAGKEVIFDQVLMLADEDGKNVQIGKPYLEGVSIVAMCEEQGKERTVRVVKYKRKIRYKKVHGHRQRYTKVKVAEVK